MRVEHKLLDGRTERESIVWFLQSSEFKDVKFVGSLIQTLNQSDSTVAACLKSFLKQKPECAHQVIKALIDRYSIWMPTDLYRGMPVLFPFAIRCPKCRGDKQRGRPEAWSTPSGDGFLLDDNTLVKGLPIRSDVVQNGRIIQKDFDPRGYIAAHVWRKPQGYQDGAKDLHGRLASRLPYLYSFVPNIAWLPVGIASLTDEDPSFAQNYYKSLSSKIYKGVQIKKTLNPLVDALWAMLPQATIPESLPDVGKLMYFKFALQEKFQGCVNDLKAVLTNLKIALGEVAEAEKHVHKRYTVANLRSLRRDRIQCTEKFLNSYLEAFEARAEFNADLKSLITDFSDEPPSAEPKINNALFEAEVVRPREKAAGVHRRKNRAQAQHQTIRIRPDLKVGKLAQLAFTEYLKVGDPAEVKRLQDGAYCHETFATARTMPVLVSILVINRAPVGLRRGEADFYKKHYSKALIFDGREYRLSNDWHELPNAPNNRAPLEAWIRRKGLAL